MNVFHAQTYKTALLDRIRDAKSKKAALTLAKIATKIGLEPTYVSRVLHSETLHFSDDQLFRLAIALEWTAVEVDYLVTLRARETTAVSERRAYLDDQLVFRRRAREYLAIREMKTDLRRMESVIESWTGEREA